MKFSFKILLVISLLVTACKKESGQNPDELKSNDAWELPGEQPYLNASSDSFYLLFSKSTNDTIYSLNFTSFGANTWEKPVEIARNRNWFINWADFPALAKNKDHLLVHTLKKSDTATYAYDVQLYQSNNKGKNWSEAFKLHTDSTKTEHGFATLLPYGEEGFFTTWLDGRNTSGGSHDDNHASPGAMNIRTATVGFDAEIRTDELVDAKTCECCQTSAAITPKGPVIVYRDRNDMEIRDIYISRRLDGSWTIPKPVFNDGWKINGCPVNGPKAAISGNTLAVAWFTAADGDPKVKLAFSDDSGANFDLPIQIKSDEPIGRVDLVLLDTETALLSWMESSEKGALLMAAKVHKEKGLGSPVAISELSAARASGFPQMEVFRDQVFFAWNKLSDKNQMISLKSVALKTFN